LIDKEEQENEGDYQANPETAIFQQLILSQAAIMTFIYPFFKSLLKYSQSIPRYPQPWGASKAGGYSQTTSRKYPASLFQRSIQDGQHSMLLLAY
jgi:hypothetical protein